METEVGQKMGHLLLELLEVTIIRLSLKQVLMGTSGQQKWGLLLHFSTTKGV